MLSIPRLIACGVTALCLTACNSDDTGSTSTDSFVSHVASVVSAKPDDAEPANVDQLAATMPENTEAAAVQ